MPSFFSLPTVEDVAHAIRIGFLVGVPFAFCLCAVLS